MFKVQTVIFVIIAQLSFFAFGCTKASHQPPENVTYTSDYHKSQTPFIHDPLEDDPKYKNIFKSIDAEVAEKLKGHPMQGAMGYCHVFWKTKKQILKEKYGIPWRSPAEMNPHILFD
jgi:hypothetical protein